MELEYTYVKDLEMALRYAVKAVEKELEICGETKDTTQEEVLKKRLDKFNFLLTKLLKENKV